MKTALIIEDNFEIRGNTTEILELAGYQVITANNGREGVSIAADRRPDFILCDIMMPEMDGYDVIKQLKSHPETLSIPFIYLTASAEKKEMELAMAMGADGYIRKPFDVRELMDTINSLLKK